MTARAQRINIFLSVAGLVLATAQFSSTRAENPLQPKQVAVFKNGYGFFLREGKVATKGGWVKLQEVPPAVLGTLWAYSPEEGLRVDQLVSGQDDALLEHSVATLEEILEANIGRVVTLEADKATYRGKLLAAPGQAVPGTTPGYPDWIIPLASGTTDTGAALPPRQIDRRTNGLVLLETSSGVVALERGRILSVILPTDAIRVKHDPIRQNFLNLHLKSKDGSGEGEHAVGLAYLRKGIRWIPSYQFSVLDESRVRVRLQANVINDIEDLEGVNLHFVVGVPHFLMEETLSPLSLQTVFTGLSSYFARRDLSAASNVLMTQQVAAPTGRAEPESNPLASDFAETATTEAGGMEDLFLYKVENVRLAKGTRGTFDLVDTSVRYHPVYLWDLGTQGQWSEREELRRDPSNPTEEQLQALLERDKIWHALRLENSSSVPWTTGPALAVRGWKPLGQDMLTYTPVGGATDLRITVATDVNGSRREIETARQRNALVRDSSRFDLVTVQGTLTVINFKKQPVRLFAKQTLEGEVKMTSAGGKARKVGMGALPLNPWSELQWEVELAAGEHRELVYEYATYVRVN